MNSGGDQGSSRIAVIAVGLFLLFDFAALALTVWLSWHIEQQAVGINLAGRQRMLSQRMVKSLLTIERSAQLGQSVESPLEELRLTFSTFDDTLQGFSSGHRTRSGEGDEIFLEAVRGEAATRVVQQANLVWMPLRSRLLEVLEAPAGDLKAVLPNAVQAVGENNQTLLRLMNDLTNELERQTQHQAGRIRIFQGAAFALALINFFWALWLYRRRIRLGDRSQSLLDDIIDKVAAAVLVVDDRGRVLKANDNAERLFGYVRDGLQGMSERQLLFSDSHGLHARNSNGQNFLVEIEGKEALVDGQRLRIVSVFDITERKRAEEYLRIAATAFEAQEGMMVTNADSVILRVNRAFTHITGYAPDEVVGQNPRILASGRHGPEFYSAMWEAIQRDGSWQGEIWNRRKDGQAYPEWLTITTVRGDEGEVSHYVGTFVDIAMRKTAEDEIKHLAFYDQLTQLANRRLMMDRLPLVMASTGRHGRYAALMLIDLDNFKALNDRLGHAVGDQLLVEAAARLKACVRSEDTVARLGGDEFVVILDDVGDAALAPVHAEHAGQKVLLALSRPYQLDLSNMGGEAHHRTHYCTSSIGIVLFSGQSLTADELLKRADTAMYQAKAKGRNTLRFFDPEMQAAFEARAALEDDLRRAVVEEQFVLHFQPQVDANGRVVGAEALVRWLHPERGLISPAVFIPLAEESGLILPLGHWVLRTACEQLAAWSFDPAMAHLTLAVNVSARQFSSPNLVEEVLAMIEVTGAPPQNLKLELTESMLLNNTEEIIAKMRELKSRGVGFSLDDFGTGYSSLSYLKRLPLDQLKIDQSFVRDVLSDSNDAAIARTVVALGQSLGLNVIAEGVETAEQRAFLADSGCNVYQGYFFSRPLPLKEFSRFLGSAPQQ